MGNFKITKKVLYKDEHGNRARVSDGFDTFMTLDFAALCPDTKCIELYDIFVVPECRHKGIGSSLLQQIIAEYNDCAILTKIAASMTEYPTEPSDAEKEKIAKDLLPFYEKNGFTNVNDVLGAYETSIACMYTGNEVGKRCYSIIENRRQINAFEAVEEV